MGSLTGDWTRDLPHSKQALSLPLGYRGGGTIANMTKIKANLQKARPNIGPCLEIYSINMINA